MKKEFGFLFWLHVYFIILYFSFPFWLDWRIILAIALLLELQYLFIRDCILSRFELGKGGAFWHHYLLKIFPSLHRGRTIFFTTYILPLLIAAIAFVLQKVFGLQPIL